MEENKPNDYAIEIPADAMRWRIHVTRLPDTPFEVDGISYVEDEATFKLSWGWTAGMTAEKLANIADDCPRGEESVITDLNLLKELRADIDKAIEEAERNPPVKSPEQITHEAERDKIMAEYFEAIIKQAGTGGGSIPPDTSHAESVRQDG